MRFRASAAATQDEAACRRQSSNHQSRIRVSSLEGNFDSHNAAEARIGGQFAAGHKFAGPWRDGLRNGPVSGLHRQRFACAHYFGACSLAFENKEENKSGSHGCARKQSKYLMKLFPYLCRFIVKRYSKPVTPIAIIRELPKSQRTSKGFLLIGYRSPNDQLQVIAIPRRQSDEWPRAGFPNSTF
jgi:hypothetical protein